MRKPKEEPKTPPGPVEPWQIVNRQQIALLLGVHDDRVTKYAKAGMPVHTRDARGRSLAFDAVAALAWWRAARTGGLDLAQERAALARVQRYRAEDELKARRGELLPRAQVVRDGLRFVMACRAKLLALPRRLVQLGHVPAEKQAGVKDLVYEALEELSKMETIADCRKAAKAAEGDV